MRLFDCLLVDINIYIVLLLLPIALLQSTGDGSSEDKSNVEPRILQFHVSANIQSRFTTTRVVSQVVNPDTADREVAFTVVLPDAAFISNFSMEIDGKEIVGHVKEKKAAQDAFDAASARGETAGLVARSSPHATNVFRVVVNVAAQAKATFNLTYQEILQRTHGVYKNVINIAPTLAVESMKIDVYISEKSKITKLTVPEISHKVGQKTNKQLLSEKPAKGVEIDQVEAAGYSFAHIRYHRTDVAKPEPGEDVDNQFVVLYDVERKDDGGEILVVDGYFVHFFAPPSVAIGSKHVIFVLDQSGSMAGKKIAQMKEAIMQIISDLSGKDYFNIVTFASTNQAWREESVEATPANRNEAIVFVEQIEDDGGTNVHSALEYAFELLNASQPTSTLAAMVVFLTDGQATEGITDTAHINRDISEWNKNAKASLHCISFGAHADFVLLKTLANNNNGLARKIYIESDTEIQLQGFFDEISSPLLSNVKVVYLNQTSSPSEIVGSDQTTLYAGSEMFRVGKLGNQAISALSIDQNDTIGSTGGSTNTTVEIYEPEPKPGRVDLNATIQSIGDSGPLEFQTDYSAKCWNVCPVYYDVITQSVKGCRSVCGERTEEAGGSIPQPPGSVGGFVERMWAYLTIKKLLDKAKYDTDTEEIRKNLTGQALDISLKYNFVTELTSIVVVQDSGSSESVDEQTLEIASTDELLRDLITIGSRYTQQRSFNEQDSAAGLFPPSTASRWARRRPISLDRLGLDNGLSSMQSSVASSLFDTLAAGSHSKFRTGSLVDGFDTRKIESTISIKDTPFGKSTLVPPFGGYSTTTPTTQKTENEGTTEYVFGGGSGPSWGGAPGTGFKPGGSSIQQQFSVLDKSTSEEKPDSGAEVESGSGTIPVSSFDSFLKASAYEIISKTGGNGHSYLSRTETPSVATTNGVPEVTTPSWFKNFFSGRSTISQKPETAETESNSYADTTIAATTPAASTGWKLSLEGSDVLAGETEGTVALHTGLLPAKTSDFEFESASSIDGSVSTGGSAGLNSIKTSEENNISAGMHVADESINLGSGRYVASASVAEVPLGETRERFGGAESVGTSFALATRRPCIKSFSTLRYKSATTDAFVMRKQYDSYNATCRDECASWCFGKSFCKAALFLPNTAGAAPNCLLSYQDDPNCAQDDAGLEETLPALLYCFEDGADGSNNVKFRS